MRRDGAVRALVILFGSFAFGGAVNVLLQVWPVERRLRRERRELDRLLAIWNLPVAPRQEPRMLDARTRLTGRPETAQLDGDWFDDRSERSV